MRRRQGADTTPQPTEMDGSGPGGMFPRKRASVRSSAATLHRPESHVWRPEMALLKNRPWRMVPRRASISGELAIARTHPPC